ncbi:aminotransferase class IV [Ferrimicrobium acidiphilum]|uniref:aminotransferase class IV n=1 Tax=Ferrimicrobium acidiphilum TaxID=121039 RepID=UPI0023F507C7|nr:aminotransferase class IV [Ferrimicrobium acidiphilum]
MTMVWIDGYLQEADNTGVPVFDHGLVCGDGAFETLVVVEGVAFAVRRHLDRLCRTARGMGLPEPDVEALRKGIGELIVRNRVDTAKIRITYTAGNSGLGSGRSRVVEPRAIIATEEIALEPATTALALAPWPRNERGVLAGLKTTSYAENVIALAWAIEQDADEVLFANTVGNLCEGSGSNIFLVRDGIIVTPPLSAGCLAGVTRDLVLEGVGATEEDVSSASLFDSSVSEVFVTSTLRMVQGVSRIDQRTFDNSPGPVTMKVQQYFAQLMRERADP